MSRLRSTEASLTPKGSVPDFEALLREVTGTSLQYQDPTGLSERLKKIEDLWDILSRRVTRIEKRVEPEDGGERERRVEALGEQELHEIKAELAELKTDTMQQVGHTLQSVFFLFSDHWLCIPVDTPLFWKSDQYNLSA